MSQNLESLYLYLQILSGFCDIYVVSYEKAGGAGRGRKLIGRNHAKFGWRGPFFFFVVPHQFSQDIWQVARKSNFDF